MSFETGGTCVLAWKKRDGLGGRLAPALRKWEQRWIVLADGQIRYYCRGDEDKFGEADFVPRGKIDLRRSKCSVQVSSQPSTDAPTPNEIEIVSEQVPPKEHTQSAMMNGSMGSSSSSSGMNSPGNNNESSSTSGANRKANGATIRWKLCFETQLDLMEFLEKAHAILHNTGQLEELDTERFEHDFHPADHVYRWEMIVCPPVIYPIQIHGIVLEAGRNCIVVADFGLTGYGKKSTEDDFHHAEDKNTQHNIIAAFKKLRPNSDQRLHITTLTDPMDIRKWTKAHYDETSFKAPDTLKKLTKITELLGKMKLSKGAAASASLKDEVIATAGSSDSTEDHAADHGLESTFSEEELEAKQKAVWEEYVKQRQEEHPLPKADPKDIVLSRANFLLEYGEERLPPYHVFFSNSECIAVWCKTGRWSTLQTAVFLSSNAIGGAKSATLATLGVAAAHAILAPVVAVGGLIWVSAPMVILKKSRAKWEENTKKMTDLYWNWAPPSAFVCAIEHWSEVGYKYNNNKTAATVQHQQQKPSSVKENSNGIADSKASGDEKKNTEESKQEEAVSEGKNDNEQTTSADSGDDDDALEDVGI